MSQILILTEGHSDPQTAKTAASVIRYRGAEVVGLLDSTQAGKTAEELLGVGPHVPVVASLDEAPAADTLLIGIAPPGGKIPPPWRRTILAAIERGMNVVSGLHEFLSDDPELARAADIAGVQLYDVRRTDHRDVATRQGIREDCLRIHTVGSDCGVGKMVTAIEVARGVAGRGVSAKFIATGQTGIMIEGDGCPIDAVVSDFVSGAIEKQVLAHQQHNVLVVEGQGSLAHPKYSAVTLGLLHGCLPQGLILCHETGRTQVSGMEQIPLQPLAHLRHVYETMARLMHPSQVIGAALNTRRLDDAAAEAEKDRVAEELGVPVCDVIRDGPQRLVDRVLQLREGI